MPWCVEGGGMSVVALKYSGGLISSRRLVHRFITGKCAIRRSPRGVGNRVIIIGAYNFVKSTRRRSVGVVLSLKRTGGGKGVNGLFIVKYLSRQFLGSLRGRLPRISHFCKGFG